MPTQANTTAPLLSSQLERHEVLPTAEAVEIVRRLAHEIAQSHAGGRLHLRIAADMVSYDSETGRIELRNSTEEARLFGGADSDDEYCPPELQQPCSVLIGVEIEVARRALQAAGLADVDPQRIDVYQLGTLLCRLLTGGSVSAFLSRPRVAAKVSPESRELIERALGHDPQRAIRTADELLRVLDGLNASVTEALPNVVSDSTRNDAKPDTTPSFVSTAKADTDTGQPVPPSRQNLELPFQKLGHYEIVGRLGSGGMGDVYRGYERALDRSVAIKVLPPELARQEDFILRFRAEATAAAKLIHPNILQIYFIGEDAGHHYFAMQHVEGESLAELLSRRGKLPVDETLAIVEQALAGLVAAHKQGLIHRDIKPGNILLDRENRRALLADFGLVKSLSSSGTGKTATGVIVGTVDYISPEQGRGRTVDGRSDLYSMGVLLFQMLSGRLPFNADNPTALIFQHVYETPPPLEQAAPDVPAPLVAIVDKLLKKSPAERHQTADEILADLRAFRAREPLPSGAARPDTSSVSAAVHPERRTAIIQAPTFDDSLLPADLVEVPELGWWERTKDRALSLFRRHAPEALQRLQNTQQQVDGAIAEYERRQRKLLPLVKEAEAALAELQAQESSWSTDAESNDSTTLAREQLRQAIEQQEEQLSSMRLRLAQVNATLSRLQSQRDLLSARLKVARVQLQWAGAGPTARPRFWKMPKLTWGVAAQLIVLVGVLGFGLFLIFDDPDERSVGQPVSKNSSGQTSAQSALVESEPDHESPVLPIRQFAGHQRFVTALAVHPDATMLASGGDDGLIALWDPQTGAKIASFQNLQIQGVQQGVKSLTFSRSGRWLVSSSSGSAGNGAETLKVWNTVQKSMAIVLAGETGLAYDVAFNSDESAVVAVLDHRPVVAERRTLDVVRWSLDSGQEIGRTSLGDDTVRFAQFSPDGTRLAIVFADGDIGLWDVDQGSLEKKLPWGSLDEKKTSAISVLAWNPDGTRLAVGTGRGRIAVWSTTTGSLPIQYSGFAQRITALSFGSHNRLLVGMASIKNRDLGEAQIVDLESSRVLRRLRGHAVYSATYSPDSRWIATGGSQPFLVMWDAELPPNEISTPVWQEAFRGHLAVAADGKSWLVASQDQQVRFRKENIDEWALLPEHSGEVSAAALSSDGRLAVVGGKKGELSLWRTEKKELLRKTRLTSRASGDQTQAAISGELLVKSLCFSADNQSVLALCAGDVIRWDVQTGSESMVLNAIGMSQNIAASPNGRHLVTGGWNPSERQGDLHLWDLETRQRVRSFNGHSHYVYGLAFSSDGSKFLSGGRSYVHIWNVETGEEIRRLTLRGPNTQQPSNLWAKGVAISPDGRLIAATGHQMVSLWDEATGEELTRITGPLVMQAEMVGFTSDGGHLVSSTPSGSVAFWEIQPQSSKSPTAEQ